MLKFFIFCLLKVIVSFFLFFSPFHLFLWFLRGEGGKCTGSVHLRIDFWLIHIWVCHSSFWFVSDTCIAVICVFSCHRALEWIDISGHWGYVAILFFEIPIWMVEFDLISWILNVIVYLIFHLSQYFRCLRRTIKRIPEE